MGCWLNWGGVREDGIMESFQEWLVHVYGMVRNCSCLEFECRLLFILSKLCQCMVLTALEIELKP